LSEAQKMQHLLDQALLLQSFDQWSLLRWHGIGETGTRGLVSFTQSDDGLLTAGSFKDELPVVAGLGNAKIPGRHVVRSRPLCQKGLWKQEVEVNVTVTDQSSIPPDRG
jgi:hypothetical protein